MPKNPPLKNPVFIGIDTSSPVQGAGGGGTVSIGGGAGGGGGIFHGSQGTPAGYTHAVSMNIASAAEQREIEKRMDVLESTIKRLEKKVDSFVEIAAREYELPE